MVCFYLSTVLTFTDKEQIIVMKRKKYGEFCLWGTNGLANLHLKKIYGMLKIFSNGKKL